MRSKYKIKENMKLRKRDAFLLFKFSYQIRFKNKIYFIIIAKLK